MNILLTGADGFTGRILTRMAEGSGHKVYAVQADLRDASAINAEIASRHVDAVLHLAGISFVGHGDETAFYSVNVLGTMNLLSALVTLPDVPKCVLLASSANIYGNCAASPIDELQAFAPVNHYAMSKVTMEKVARLFSDRLPVVIARPFNYTGQGQALQFLIPKLVDHFKRRAPSVELGNLNVEREFNDVRMVCAAYLALLEKGHVGEAYNVCTGNSYSLTSVVQALQSLTGHLLEIRDNPEFVREGEVHKLCGNPSKLLATVGQLKQYTLLQTLSWMLETP